jgi:hypothetical protein
MLLSNLGLLLSANTLPFSVVHTDLHPALMSENCGNLMSVLWAKMKTRFLW